LIRVIDDGFKLKSKHVAHFRH